MLQRARGTLLLLAAVAGLAQACQPVDDVDLASVDDEAEGDVAAAADDLSAFEEAAESVAHEWDAGARLVEMAVELDEERAWLGATATFVAPDADRMLVLSIGEDGISEQQPTLETFGFVPVPAEALERVPALPGAAAEPAVAAEEAGAPLDDCGIAGSPHEILYASGAPGAWDGSAWAPSPSWSLTVLAQGGGVLLGLDGTPVDEPCFELPWEDA